MTTKPDADRGQTYDPNAESAAKPPEKASLIEDFIDIFYAPTMVFARRARSSFWGPLLVVAIISALFAFANRAVFEQIFDVEFQRGAAKAMADNPRVTEDMLNTQRKLAGAVAGFFQYIGVPLLIFIVALFVWASARMLKAKITYQQAALIMTLAFIPRLVQALLTTVQMLLMDVSNITSMHSLSFSPARFMDPDTTSKQLLGLFSRFDLFTIWVTILIGIGIAIIGKVPRSRGYAAAAIVWVVGTIPVLFSR